MQMMPSTFKGYRDKHLPDDIFDPVANAVASIRYIQQEYLTGNKTGSPVDINWIVANHKRRGGYDAGGMITEPVIGRGLRSGRSYAIGEYGPEYILGRRATSALLGGGAGSASMGIGGFLASAHPGAGSGGYVDSSSVNFYGLTYEQAEVRQRSAQRRRALLKGAGRVT
jgi:hypothetical protein